MRINKQIRSPRVRVIGADGRQIGVMTSQDALAKAEAAGLDLVEISPGAEPPVCKIVDYGKYRYDQTKKEKEHKKSQTVIKVKEIKVKPNIDKHDLETKLKSARQFLDKGNKVKVTCMFRGREITHPELGTKVVEAICENLADLGKPESELKRFGRTIVVVLAPTGKKK